VYESCIESGDDDQDEEGNEKADILGFTKAKTGWFSTVANTEFTTHSYHDYIFTLLINIVNLEKVGLVSISNNSKV
jgi:hypothetical protein